MKEELVRVFPGAKIVLATIVCGSIALVGCGGGGGDGGTGPDDSDPLAFESYDAGFFSIEKPRGWDVFRAGSCSELAFLLRDPAEPLRQIFYFGTVGPIYTREEQRALDQWYLDQGGYDVITWLDAPAVDPLTPENYLAHWPEIASMEAAARFMPQFPRLESLTVIASVPQAAMVPGGSTSEARGLFVQDGRVGEGMFLATVKVFSPYTGTPGAGTAYGHFICGVTAPKAEFAGAVERLIESLSSFTIDQSYVEACLIQQAQAWGAVAAAGRTLSEASDAVFEGWEARSHVEDISAERWTDAYRGIERAYDPATGDVYEFPAGWYEAYDLDRGAYNHSGLELLPSDDWDLWMRAALDGPNNVYR